LVGKRREYCHQHPDRAALTCRQWYQQNGEKKRAYARRHRQQHPGVYRAWVERNRELIRQHARQRYHADPSKSAAKAHERRARLRMTDGTFTPEQWQAVLLFYGDRCLCCGTKGRMTIDHIIPLIIGGRNVIDNIQPLCRSCNARKHDKAIDYRPRPMPEVPVADALRRV
jgi:5-methylcytosine-specific restriction endonuclease McrA